jgi:hypothetical protein
MNFPMRAILEQDAPAVNKTKNGILESWSDGMMLFRVQYSNTPRRRHFPQLLALVTAATP